MTLSPSDSDDESIIHCARSMSWYQSYVKDSSLYGSARSVSPKPSSRSVKQQQQQTATLSQPLLSRDRRDRHPGCLQLGADDGCFTFKGFVQESRSQVPCPSSTSINATMNVARAVAPSAGSPDTAAVVAELEAEGLPAKKAKPSLLISQTDKSSVRDQLPAASQLSQATAPSHPGPQQAVAPEYTPSNTGALAAAAATAVTAAVSPAAADVADTSIPSLPSITCPTPRVEVELQRRSRTPRQVSSSGRSDACIDPLLHWTECWAGPGLRRRTRAAQQQEQRLSNAPPSSPRATAQQQHQQQQQASIPSLPTRPQAPAGSRQPGSPSATPGISRTNSSSSMNLSSPRLAHPGGQQQQQQLRQAALRQRSSLRWWLLGGAGLAALSGCAVVAVYGVMTYMLKAAMVYSLAWKAATGVAAAEGLALGGWSVSNARASKAASAAAAAELSRLRNQAGRELAAMRALLQQKESAHGQEVSSLSVLNDKLSGLAKTLKSENASLLSALQQAAADRKALEAAAALESSRAETRAVVGVAAAHSERVVDEVSGLAAQQQQLVALVCELREDLMGLVVGGDHTHNNITPGSGTGTTGLLEKPRSGSNVQLSESSGMLTAQIPAVVAVDNGTDMGRDAKHNSCAAAAPAGEEECTVSDGVAEMLPVIAGLVTLSECSQSSPHTSCNQGNCQHTSAALSGKVNSCKAPTECAEDVLAGQCRCVCAHAVEGFVAPPLRSLKSVRSGVDAALAATIADTLQL